MVARARIHEAEAHGNLVEEAQLGHGRLAGGKIIANEENNFVVARLHFIGGEQRHFRASVGGGLGGGDERAVFAIERPEFDLHSRRRAAVRGVEDVRA